MATKEIGLVLKRLHNPWTVFVGSGVDMRLSEEFEDPPTRAQVRPSLRTAASQLEKGCARSLLSSRCPSVRAVRVT